MKTGNILKTHVIITLGIIWAGLLTGCSDTNDEATKLRSLDYTVVATQEQPDALRDVIEEKKEQPFQISYIRGEELYLAVGYGQQETGGYSISVNDLFETQETIVLDTTLLGPQSQEEAADTPSYPYIVVKTAQIEDKTTEFR